MSGQPFTTPPVVEIRGASGVVVSGAADVVTAAIASGTGTITAGGQAPAANGVASFTNLRISGSGPHTLRFTATGLTAATSNTFTVVTPLSTTQAIASKTGTVNTAVAAFVPVTASGGTTPYTYALSGGTLPNGMSFGTSTGQVSGTPTAALSTTTFTVTVTDATNATSSKTFQLTVNAAIPPLTTAQNVASMTGHRQHADRCVYAGNCERRNHTVYVRVDRRQSPRRNVLQHDDRSGERYTDSGARNDDLHGHRHRCSCCDVVKDLPAHGERGNPTADDNAGRRQQDRYRQHGDRSVYARHSERRNDAVHVRAQRRRSPSGDVVQHRVGSGERHADRRPSRRRPSLLPSPMPRSATSSKTFQLTVNAAIPPLSTTLALATVNGTVNSALSVTPVTASGGTTPYTFTLSGGTLPAGLNFNAGTGLLSGTPTASIASTSFTVTARDATTATSAKSFTLTVSAASSTSECATPGAGWIFCDDFDTDRLSSYFEYDNAGGKFVRTTSAGRGSSTGMRATYTTGQQGAGSLHLAFGRTPSSYFHPADAGTQNYREVYWRFYIRREPGWVGNGATKLTRAMIFAKSDFSQAMIAHGWTSDSDDRYLLLDPASGTDVSGNLITVGYNDFAHLRWFGATQSAAPEEDQAHVGQWACYEFHAKLNDAGQSNGIFELTINGQLSARSSGLNWIGSYNAYGINSIYLEQYQNAGAPAANVRVIDNFVVSTQPIGCSAP